MRHYVEFVRAARVERRAEIYRVNNDMHGSASDFSYMNATILWDLCKRIRLNAIRSLKFRLLKDGPTS